MRISAAPSIQPLSSNAVSNSSSGCCFLFVTVKLGPLINGSMTVIAMIFGLVINCLELLVAFIQAYVFTMLSAVFIGMAHQEEHI